MWRTILLGILAGIAPCLRAAPTADEAAASREAEKIYSKEKTFANSVSSTFAKYEAWRAEEIKFLNSSGIRFGAWSEGKTPEGFPKFSCEIESPKDAAIGITLYLPEFSEIRLNGEKVGENTSNRRTPDPRIASLALKAGKNDLSICLTRRVDGFHYGPYCSPYADPIIRLRELFRRDYPEYTRLLAGDTNLYLSNNYRGELERTLGELIERSLFSAGKFEEKWKRMAEENVPSNSSEWLELYSEIIETRALELALKFDVKNLGDAIGHLSKKYPRKYPEKYAKELADWEKAMPSIIEALKGGDATGGGKLAAYHAFAREALLANPLLEKYRKIVYVVRKPGTPEDGMPTNWQTQQIIKEREKWGDEIWIMDIADPEGARLLFKSPETPAVTDLRIDWDAKKLMFSSIDSKNRWQLFEISSDGTGLKMLTPGIHDGVDAYDGAYLPNGKIVFCYTACHAGVPCNMGVEDVCNLYVMDPDAGSPEAVDKSIRQLTFEQDADWHPAVTNDGRIMYTRWEYTDNSHYFSRILFTMNPDGTGQSALYGSTSYWPNSLFFSKPIPGSSSKFLSLVSGHHGVRRSGEIHLFDTSAGTTGDEGRIHKFPSYGRKYVAKIKDELVDSSWPQFLHPYPLSEDFVIASARTPEHGWRLYLIDKFDNMLEIQKSDRGAIFEASPLAPRKRPPVIPDRVAPKLKENPRLDTGYVFLNDIYQGPGLAGVPHGEVKSLRVFEYNYGYRLLASHEAVGQEASWDMKRIRGTVPVEKDGSAMFEVPANRPIAIQPLDKDGKALALMRSWFVVMPGETQSCVGCHETQGTAPVQASAMASRKAPSKIAEFMGPVRGFSFARDVQPVLDKYCVGCHDGSKEGAPNLSRSPKPAWKNFSRAYMALHPLVRRSGPESNQNMLVPSEFSANTSELVQMLKKGHHGVNMDADAWRMLYTWIDLNVPYNGTWKEIRPDVPNGGDRERMKFLALYANRFDDPEKIEWDPGPQKFEAPKPPKTHPQRKVLAKGWPFGPEAAAEMAGREKLPKEISVDLGNGQSMRFALVPAGSFVMGSNSRFYDEGPAAAVKVEKPFYMAVFETTNAQYAAFDKSHNSGFLDRHWKDHINQGYPANLPEQPVVRVSWKEAKSFADWLSKKHGISASLPTERQWEWAARAGSDRDFWYGNIGDDFSKFENLSDLTTKKFAVMGVDPQPIHNPSPEMAFVPADLNFDDGSLVSAKVGSYAPNAFGLYDMGGNVAEWSLDDYSESLGGKRIPGRKVARGGSWRDRPKFAPATLRREYPEWQKVYNVGVRLVINDAEKAAAIFGAKGE